MNRFQIGDILRRRGVDRRIKATYFHEGQTWIRLDYIPPCFPSETTISETEALSLWELVNPKSEAPMTPIEPMTVGAN